jgi:hypothetical protein
MTRRGSKQQGPDASRRALQERLDRFRAQQSAFAAKRTPPVRPSAASVRRGETRQRRG